MPFSGHRTSAALRTLWSHWCSSLPPPQCRTSQPNSDTGFNQLPKKKKKKETWTRGTLTWTLPTKDNGNRIWMGQSKARLDDILWWSYGICQDTLQILWDHQHWRVLGADCIRIVLHFNTTAHHQHIRRDRYWSTWHRAQKRPHGICMIEVTEYHSGLWKALLGKTCLVIIFEKQTNYVHLLRVHQNFVDSDISLEESVEIL